MSASAKVIESDVLKFQDNINTFLQENKEVPHEIIELAKFAHENPYIIENIIETPNPQRCIACCYNKQQCSKNKKNNSPFCGIHIKGTPYGILPQKNEKSIHIEVSLIDIHGILCYVDSYHHVYHAEDVIHHAINPRIIATWDGTHYTPITSTPVALFPSTSTEILHDDT